MDTSHEEEEQMKMSICWMLCLSALASCTTTEHGVPRARPSVRETHSSPTSPCAETPPPFEAGYLPDGFSARLRKGAGLFKGTNYPTEGLLGHYIGPREGIHINFETDPGPLPYELNNARPISTLGTNGRIASIEGGFAVAFTFKECDYRMDTYGISRKETLQVARGLIGRIRSSDRCPAIFPFEPRYLPAGFRSRASVGAGKARFPDRPPEVIHTYRGGRGTKVEIHRPGTLFTELAQGDDAPTLDVLGFETTGFGPIQPGGDDFIVWFQHPPVAGPHQWCKTYSLNEYGVSLEELKRVAEGLEPR
jgi:hypothetical protein